MNDYYEQKDAERCELAWLWAKVMLCGTLILLIGLIVYGLMALGKALL